MKRTGIYYLVGIVLAVLFTSCLEGNDYSELSKEEEQLTSKEEEQLTLNKYLNNIISNKHDVDTTALGVYYVTTRGGTGAFPKNGDTLTVGYAGYFLDGTLFDLSVWHNPINYPIIYINGYPYPDPNSPTRKDSTFTFVLGTPPSIKGWDDGMKVINKNATVQLIVPSDLAYGSAGAGVIPPYKTLVFVVKMKSIKPSI